MIQTIATFAIGVFAVWYLPAAKAAIVGNAGSPVAALLAGVLISLPVTLLASLGAVAVLLVARSSIKLFAWQSVAAGVLCGLFTQIITKIPETPSRVFEVVSSLWSPVPVLLRIIIAGGLIGLLMLAAGKHQSTVES